MHDIQNLDQRGVPGVAVATVAFLEAVEAQSNALGFKPGIVWVPHPIQNRTVEELVSTAVQSIDQILSFISPPSQINEENITGG